MKNVVKKNLLSFVSSSESGDPINNMNVEDAVEGEDELVVENEVEDGLSVVSEGGDAQVNQITDNHERNKVNQDGHSLLFHQTNCQGCSKNAATIESLIKRLDDLEQRLSQNSPHVFGYDELLGKYNAVKEERDSLLTALKLLMRDVKSMSENSTTSCNGQLDDSFKAPTKPKRRADDRIDKFQQDQRDKIVTSDLPVPGGKRSRNIKIRAQLKILTERDIDKNLFTDVSSLDARHLQSRNEY